MPSSPTGFTGIPAIASSPWAYPLLESFHVLGVALLVGNLVLLELRVWGRGAELPVQPLARLALSVSVSGFGLVGLTGLLMFAAAPAELLANKAFVVKMGLVMFAGLNAAWFHARQGLKLLDGMARAQTLLSLGLWLAVIICGRWIAYV
ncbi:MAG: hypothetical protein H7Z19_19365 [Chitinophagaceae bacterium]|nr:hypothetical protein [Rubrivivax sp.]